MNTFSHPRFRLGWILLLIGIVNGLFWTLFRWNWENHYLQTQLTLDFEDTRSLSDAFGVPQSQMLRDFKKRGATSLAIYDQSLGTLRDNGRVAISSREIAERTYPSLDWKTIPGNLRYLVTSTDTGLMRQITPRLIEQADRDTKLREVALPDGGKGLLIPASKQLVNDAQVGFDPQQLQLAKAEGYIVTARISNPLNLTPVRLNQLLDDVQKQAGAKVLLFSEDEVLGYDTLISPAARAMRSRGLLFTNIEFSKQRGAPDFAKNTDGEIVRVHSVQGDEAARAEPEVLTERFVRAAKDRNMRVLYVRLLRQQKGEPKEIEKGDVNAPLVLEKTPYQQNLDFVEEVSKEITEPISLFGVLPLSALRPPMTMGEAHPFTNYPTSIFEPALGSRGATLILCLSRFLAGLGVVGATLLVLNLFFDWSEKARRNWLLLGLFMVAGLSVSAGMGAKLMSLMAGITAPIVGMMWSGMPEVWDGLNRPKGQGIGAIFSWALKIMLRSIVIILGVALLIVTLLNNWKYMSKADEFLGEKATQWLPLLLIPLAFMGELFPHRVIETGASAGGKRIMTRVGRVLDQAFTLKVVFLFGALLFAAYIWMARFGNESGMTISPAELALRGLLEKVLIARPRTKEFAMGHPAFFVALWFMWRGQRWPAFFMLLAAVIGQADVLNTMCHIHTPVFYSLWRTLAGVIVGSVVGFVTLALLERLRVMPRFAPYLAPRSGAISSASPQTASRNFASSSRS